MWVTVKEEWTEGFVSWIKYPDVRRIFRSHKRTANIKQMKVELNGIMVAQNQIKIWARVNWYEIYSTNIIIVIHLILFKYYEQNCSRIVCIQIINIGLTFHIFSLCHLYIIYTYKKKRIQIIYILRAYASSRREREAKAIDSAKGRQWTMMMQLAHMISEWMKWIVNNLIQR